MLVLRTLVLCTVVETTTTFEAFPPYRGTDSWLFLFFIVGRQVRTAENCDRGDLTHAYAHEVVPVGGLRGLL